jgi:small-conductance mechanosensitive channel
MKKINNIIVILMISGFLLFFTSVSFSQINLAVGNENSDAPAIPIVENLSVKWWQYFESANDIEEINHKFEEFLEGLKTSVAQNNINESEATLENIKTLFNQYVKQRYSDITAPTDESFTTQKKYTIKELLEYNNHILKIKKRIHQTEEEKQSINENLLSANQQIDQQKIKYYDLSNTNEDKIQAGLEWIILRIKLALENLRYSHIEEKNKYDINQLDFLNTNVSSMISKLEITENAKPDIDVQKLTDKLKNLEQKIDLFSIKLTESFDDSDESHIKKDIIKLDLALSLIESSKTQMLLQRNQHIELLTTMYNTSKVDLLEVRKYLTDSDIKAKENEKAIAEWQKLALNMLLLSISEQGNKTPKKILQLDKSKREKAQQVIKDLESLKSNNQENLFILGLINNKLKEVDTGFTKTWSLIKDFITSSKDNIVSFIYKPIFTINEYPVTLLPLIKLLLIIFVAYIISKIVTFFIHRIEKRLKIDRMNDRSSIYLMHRLLNYLIILISVITGFSVLGINLGNITLIAGALSVGIGFGLQNLVSNFVSGLTIMFERTLSVGDYIEVDGQTTGVVREIRARSTRINTNDNIDIIIPNSDLVTNKIINWTLKESIRRIKIPFGVAYGTDKELVKKAALEAADNVQYTLHNIHGKEPDVWLMEFGDNSVNYLLLVWVAHYGLRRPNRIKNYYNWELDTAFKKYGIEIPFPQRDVHLNIVRKSKESNTDFKKTENEE